MSLLTAIRVETAPDPTPGPLLTPVAPAPGRPAPAKPGASRIREINDTIRYAMWSVFAVAEPLGDEDRGAVATEVEELFTDLASRARIVPGPSDPGPQAWS